MSSTPFLRFHSHLVSQGLAGRGGLTGGRSCDMHMIDHVFLLVKMGEEVEGIGNGASFRAMADWGFRRAVVCSGGREACAPEAGGHHPSPRIENGAGSSPE